MQLAEHTVLFSIGEIPAIGNYATGGLLGLTQDGQKLCEAMHGSDISQAQVPSSCIELVSRLAAGGYLQSGSATPDPTPNQKKRAYLHVTQRCNLDCLFCYSKTSARNALPDPSITNLKRSVDLIASWGATHLIVSGGEPFLRDDLSTILSHAQRRSIKRTTIISNGTNISPAKLKPLVDVVGEIAISFDGWNNESPAWLRGEQRFDTLKRSVDLIKGSGIQAQIIVTLHGKNYAHIQDYRALSSALDVPVSFSLLLDAKGKDTAYSLSPEALAFLGKEEAKSAGLESLCCKRACGAGVASLSIDADGSVYPCHMLHRRDLLMGNAFKNSEDEIFSSRTAQLFRNLNSDQIQSCAHCEHRPLCGGGCRARALSRVENEITSRDPYCPLSFSYYSSLAEKINKQFLRKED